MKLVIRADDYGYTKVHNIGTLEAIENGIVTSVDTMFDTPGTDDALEKIKDFPFISIGWHSHFWGCPVADPKDVSSLIDETGRFKFRVNQKLKEDTVFEEALIECRAQIEKCIRVIGRVPDTTGNVSDGNPVDRAKKQVCDEYGIAYGFVSQPFSPRMGRASEALEKYKNLDIFMPVQHESVFKILYAEYANDRRNYDPVRYFVEDPDHLQDHAIAITAWHPGYLDDFVYRDSSTHFNLARPQDVEALTSDAIKQWIKDKKIELINHRDAILGTSEYQNHLKAIGSDLWVKKF